MPLVVERSKPTPRTGTYGDYQGTLATIEKDSQVEGGEIIGSL